MSSHSAGESIKKFAEVIESTELISKYEEVIKIYKGTIQIARDKFDKIDTDEGREILCSISTTHYTRVRRDVIEQHEEEVEKARCVLKEIEATIVLLQSVYETIGQRLEGIRNDGNDNDDTPKHALALSCYEDCRCILIFLRLRAKILKQGLLTPIDKKINPDPFEHCPEFKFEEENFVYLLSKLKNGTSENGKTVTITESLEEVLLNIGEVFGETEFTRLFTSKGGEITHAKHIKDDETLYVSKGEAFIPILSRSFINQPRSQTSSEWVKLNVGGQIFYTSRTTLLNKEPDSMLARMFDQTSNIQPSCLDCNGAYLIDRNPKYFSPILNYLRSGSLILDPDTNPKGVLEEAQFFGIQSCIPDIEALMVTKEDGPLTRRDVINALIITPNKDVLRFQGVNLCGADLSYLDLRNINFKYAKLRNAKLCYSNLSNCNFERADMTYVEMNCAILSGVRMACAIMEGANCSNCNFQDPSGSSHANMEGVNLRNAILEDSDLTGANLRVANLKHANLKATILRGAILAGADLGMCDLTGSDLHEANLRGANLKDASLELMINPLHMSQAIR